MQKGIILRYVCICVEAKHLRSIRVWQALNAFYVQINCLAFWDVVSLIEAEVICEHVLPKPHLKRALGT